MAKIKTKDTAVNQPTNARETDETLDTKVELHKFHVTIADGDYFKDLGSFEAETIEDVIPLAIKADEAFGAYDWQRQLSFIKPIPVDLPAAD